MITELIAKQPLVASIKEVYGIPDEQDILLVEAFLCMANEWSYFDFGDDTVDKVVVDFQKAVFDYLCEIR